MLEITDKTTLRDLYSKSITLGARCTRCGHSGILLPPKITEYMHILGESYSVTQFAERLCCSKCKGTGVRVYTMTR